MNIVEESKKSVKCIRNSLKSALTIGKSYTVWYEEDDCIRVVGDKGRLIKVRKSFFDGYSEREEVDLTLKLQEKVIKNFTSIATKTPVQFKKLSRKELQQLLVIQHKLL